MLILLLLLLFLLPACGYLLGLQARQKAYIALLQKRLAIEQRRSEDFYEQIKEEQGMMESFYRQYVRREGYLQKKNSRLQMLLTCYNHPMKKARGLNK